MLHHLCVILYSILTITRMPPPVNSHTGVGEKYFFPPGRYDAQKGIHGWADVLLDVRTACLLQIGDGAEHVESRAVPEDALVHLEGGAVHGVVRGGIVVGDIEEGKDAGDHLLEIGEVLVAHGGLHILLHELAAHVSATAAAIWAVIAGSFMTGGVPSTQSTVPSQRSAAETPSTISFMRFI